MLEGVILSRLLVDQSKYKDSKRQYIIILMFNLQQWSQLNRKDEEPCPPGRSAHAAVCLGYGESNPQLLVTGGWAKVGERIMNDVWMLDVQSGKWREVRIFQLRGGGRLGGIHTIGISLSVPHSLYISWYWKILYNYVHEAIYLSLGASYC